MRSSLKADKLYFPFGAWSRRTFKTQASLGKMIHTQEWTKWESPAPLSPNMGAKRHE
jgi:hypothetical protein